MTSKANLSDIIETINRTSFERVKITATLMRSASDATTNTMGAYIQIESKKGVFSMMCQLRPPAYMDGDGVAQVCFQLAKHLARLSIEVSNGGTVLNLADGMAVSREHLSDMRRLISRQAAYC
jgi:hypothetical protein